MRRLLLAGFVLVGLWALGGCSYGGGGGQDAGRDDGGGDGGDNGGKTGLTGDMCDIIYCGYDIIECGRYPSPNAAIAVHYLKMFDAGQEWTAKILIDVEGISPVEGQRIEGSEFLNRVFLSRPGSMEQWPDFEGNFCEFTQGGDNTGEEMTGTCAFAFVNGYSVTAEFSCILESVQP
jgi:hypothetical protein